MSLQTLFLDAKPVDLALSKSGTRLAVLSNSGLTVYALDMVKRPIPKPVRLWSSEAVNSHNPRHVAFVGDNEIHVLTDNWNEDESSLWHYAGEELIGKGPIVEAETVSLLISSVSHSQLYAEFQNGALHQICTRGTAADLPPETSFVHKFPSFCPEVQITDVEEKVY